MKKTLKILGTILVAAFILSGISARVFAAGDVAINATNFPDENFRKYISEKFDEDGDGVIAENQIKTITYMNCSQRKISNLKGLELFPNMVEFNAEHNQVSSLDLRKNTKLRSLQMLGNKLNSLNLTNCPELVSLELFNNNLSSLDLSHNTKLERLQVRMNPITSLDISNCAPLVDLVKNGIRREMLDDYFYYKNADDGEYDWKLAIPHNMILITNNKTAPTKESEAVESEPTTPADEPTIPESITVNVGESVKIISDPNATDMISLLKFKSAKTSIAKVDSKGNVTGIKAGSTKITITTTVNDKKATVTVKVVDPYKPTKITITQGKKYTLKVGKTLKLKYKLTPETAKTTVKWKSSKKTVATVNAKTGVVKAKKAGTAKITVTTGNKKKAMITIKVKK